MDFEKFGITREDVLDAIERGVKDAFLIAMEAGDGLIAETIREPILEAITQGVYRSMDMPCKEDLKDIYFDAFRQSQ